MKGYELPLVRIKPDKIGLSVFARINKTYHLKIKPIKKDLRIFMDLRPLIGGLRIILGL
jgi:hypothetical protein